MLDLLLQDLGYHRRDNWLLLLVLLLLLDGDVVWLRGTWLGHRLLLLRRLLGLLYGHDLSGLRGLSLLLLGVGHARIERHIREQLLLWVALHLVMT